MIFTSLIQQTAVNVFNMYCNRIVTVINATMPDDRKVLANRATQVYGVAGFVAMMISPIIINRFEHRLTILKGG